MLDFRIFVIILVNSFSKFVIIWIFPYFSLPKVHKDNRNYFPGFFLSLYSFQFSENILLMLCILFSIAVISTAIIIEPFIIFTFNERLAIIAFIFGSISLRFSLWSEVRCSSHVRHTFSDQFCACTLVLKQSLVLKQTNYNSCSLSNYMKWSVLDAPRSIPSSSAWKLSKALKNANYLLS